MRRTQGLLVVGIVLLLFPMGMYSASCTRVVLVTGFEPFGNYTVNPSQLIAEALNGSTLSDAVIVGIVLPVEFSESVDMATDAIQQYHPDLVIGLGLNARAQGIRVEKIGVNLKRYPNDDGTWTFPRRIDVSGPFIRFSPLHAHGIVQKIRQANISAQLSCFAGTYICNSLLYQLLGYSGEQNSTRKIGFIHVPLLDSQDPDGMPLQSMIDAVTIAIQTSLD